MSPQIISCHGCGLKIGIHEDQVIPIDAVCPSCGHSLFSSSSSAEGQRKSLQTMDNGRLSRSPAQVELHRITFGWPFALLALLLMVGVAVGTLLLRTQFAPVLSNPSPIASNGAIESAAQTEPASDTVPVQATQNETEIPPQDKEGQQLASTAEPSADSATATKPVATMPPDTEQRIAVKPESKIDEPKIPLAKYRAAPDSLHYYNYEIVADMDSYKMETSGACMLTAIKDVPRKMRIKKEHRKGNGTGFAISSDGLLITCAHVVDEVESIEVEMNGRNYIAKVLHIDPAIDLAVIKIDATDLSTLPLGNSEQIQLGQKLSVIGFPLLEVLGSGIKFTQGSVSGIVDRLGQRQIQTDATINPGNSGGPVFDSFGNVVAVASSKFSGEVISQIGFCVPSSTVSKFLAQHGLEAKTSINSNELDTPALVAKASPAIALIKTIDDSSHQSHIAFQHTTTNYDRSKSFGSNPIEQMFSISRYGYLPSSESGNIVLSEFGKLINVSSGELAPVIMCRLPLLPFIELPKYEQTEWEQRQEISIEFQERPSPQGRSPLDRRNLFNPLERFDRLDPFSGLYSGRGQQEKVSVKQATETNTFRIVTNNAKELIVNRSSILKTTGRAEPRFEISSSGTWTFDRELGMPLESDLKGECQVTSNRVTVSIPFTVKVSRWTKEEMDRLEKNVAKKLENSKNSQESSSQPAPATVKRENTSDALHTIPSTTLWSFNSLAIAPNGRSVVVTDNDKQIHVFDVATGTKIDTDTLESPGSPYITVYSPNSRYLLVGGYDGIIRIWKVDEQGKIETHVNFVGHSSEIKAINIAADNNTVISCDDKNRVRVWDLENKRERFSIADAKENSIASGFSSDSRLGFVVDRSGKLSKFSLLDGKAESSYPIFKSHFGLAASFSQDGRFLFIPESSTVCIHTIDESKSTEKIELGDYPTSVDYCPNTNEMVAGGNGKLHIIDCTKKIRTEILSCGEAVGSVPSVVISDDGRYIAAIRDAVKKNVLIFDRQKYEEKKE
jgi:S1-C subfamily serine protease